MSEEIKLLGLDLSLASELLIEILIEDPPGPEIFDEILRANTKRPGIMKLLFESPSVPEGVREEAGRVLHLPARPEDIEARRRQPATEEQRKVNLLQKIRTLMAGEKIALAMRGGREVRSILAKDTNKEVVLSVLKNPKVTETEAEFFAHSRNIPDEALRMIAKNREWMKSYAVVSALVKNPKTPVGISSALVMHLKTKDITALEKNRNVPEAVRAAAKRLSAARRPK